MIAKLTTKNQITLPKAVISKFPGVDYFSVRVADGEIVLTPVRKHDLDSVWHKIEALGIAEKDVTDAVRWARGPGRGVKSPVK